MAQTFKRGDRVKLAIRMGYGTITLPAVVRSGTVNGLVEIKALAPVAAPVDHPVWSELGIMLVKFLKTKPMPKPIPITRQGVKSYLVHPGDYGMPLAHMRVRPEVLVARTESGPDFEFANSG